MTDLQNLFLAAYPLFPKNLVEKFDSLLSFEVAKFNNAINPNIIEKYNALSESIVTYQAPDATINIFTPKASKTMRADFSFYPQVWLTIDEFGDLGSPYNQLCQYIVYFDSRLFSGVDCQLTVNYGSTIEVSQKRNPAYIAPRWPLYVNSGNKEYIEIYFRQILFLLTVTPKLLPYSGANSALAMAENGVDIQSNIDLLKEFCVYLNGYEKYNSELQANISLQKEKNRQDLIEYKNNINDKLTERKNSLNDLRTQIGFAAKNELNSAKRDMQNLSLTAQTLIMQLQEKMQ
jgi:hypothetical protein